MGIFLKINLEPLPKINIILYIFLSFIFLTYIFVKFIYTSMPSTRFLGKF